MSVPTLTYSSQLPSPVRSTVPISDYLFFIALGVWLTRSFLDVTLFGNLIAPFGYRAIVLAILALLFVGELFKSHDYRFFVAAVIFAISTVVALKTGVYSLLPTVAFVYAARNINFRRIATFALVLTATLFLFVVVSSQIGIIEDYIWDYRVPNARERHCLGFRYTTYPTHFYLLIVLLYGYLKRTSISLSSAIVLLAGDYLLFSLTGSRNSFILVAFFLFAMLALKTRFFSSLTTPRVLRWFGAWSVPASIVFFFALILAYRSRVSFAVTLNGVLSNRLSQTSAALQTYPITLFGQEIPFMGNGLLTDGTIARLQAGDFDYNFIDNSYFNILVNDGILLFFIVVIGFFALGWRSARAHDVVLALILFVIAVHSTIDPQLIDLPYNTFLLLLLAPVATRGAGKPTHDKRAQTVLGSYTFPYQILKRRHT